MNYIIDVPKETIKKIKSRDISALDINEYNQLIFALRTSKPIEEEESDVKDIMNQHE